MSSEEIRQISLFSFDTAEYKPVVGESFVSIAMQVAVWRFIIPEVNMQSDLI